MMDIIFTHYKRPPDECLIFRFWHVAFFRWIRCTLWRITEYSWYTYLASTGLGIHIWPKQRLQIIKIRSTDYPKKYTITHIAGGAMLKYFTATLSSSCSVPIWTSILGTKTAKTKQPIYLKPTQPNEYCIIQNKFQVWIIMFILLT